DAMRKAWDGYVCEVFPAGDKTTPGFPDVQWVCVPASDDGYPAQWDRAQRLLAARRLVRSFDPVPDQEWRQRTLCSLAARWPAESGGPWVYEDRWRPQTLAREATSDPARRAELERQITKPAADGQRAAGRLAKAMDRLRRDDPAIPRLTGYLAVLVQDLD